jgi:adenylate cyclase
MTEDGATQVPPTEVSTVARLEEQLLGGPRTLSLTDMARQIGADPEEVRMFWHALGLPSVEPDAVAFTQADADAVDVLHRAMHEYEVSERTATSIVRSIGHTTDRLVVWQVEALVEHMAERYELDDVTARILVLDRLGEVVPLLETQLVHAWRRQLAALAGRFAAEFAGAGRSVADDELPLARAVGFADMVSFTRRTAHLDPHDLAAFVQQFETRARDVVTTAGGRVVKTIGDAVLFVADDVATGAEIALGLAEAFGSDGGTPVRVSCVWGRVLSRFGDVFGPSVNLAARLTDEAAPASVLLDPATAQVVTSLPGYRLTELAPRQVPGLGMISPVLLERAGVEDGARRPDPDEG